MKHCGLRVRMSDQFSRSTTPEKPGSCDTIIRDPMTHVYRISKGPDDGEVLDSIEFLEVFARSHGPGR
jgi:hypothetical protein